MIELFTGIPRSGKSLSRVHVLARMHEKWEKTLEGRPVFILGIPDLLIPHSPVPLVTVRMDRAGAECKVPDWDAMPDGSLVIIDESQNYGFPPRSSASTAPPHVAWLNTHGHRGFDIWFITQHPKLIDGSLRALVGKHQHYRRLFGSSRAIVYEWDGCSDSLSGTKNAIKSFFNYPRDTFKLYKSATLHTKQTFKLPLWLVVPFLGILLGIYFVPKAYGVLSNGVSGKGIKADDSKPVQTAPAKPQEAPKQAPSTAGHTSTAQNVPVRVEPLLISACIASATRCQCYSHHGVKISLPDSECRESAISPSEKFRLDESTRIASN